MNLADHFPEAIAKVACVILAPRKSAVNVA